MSPTELLIACLGGVIRRLREAIDLEGQGHAELCALRYDSAGRIIAHLQNTLDSSSDPLAAKLASLYAFLCQQVAVAGRERDSRIARDCIEILSTLREGWEDALGDAHPFAPDNDEDDHRPSSADHGRKGWRQRLAGRPRVKGKR